VEKGLDTDRCEEMFLSLSAGIQQGDPQSVRAAVQVLALKAAIKGYKSSDTEVELGPGPTWSSVLSKEQTVDLFKEAISILLQAALRSERWRELRAWKPRSSKSARPRLRKIATDRWTETPEVVSKSMEIPAGESRVTGSARGTRGRWFINFSGRVHKPVASGTLIYKPPQGVNFVPSENVPMARGRPGSWFLKFHYVGILQNKVDVDVNCAGRGPVR
jgi:hypothetical protein